MQIPLVSFAILIASGVSAQSDETCTGNDNQPTDTPCEYLAWNNPPLRRSPNCCDHFRQCEPTNLEVEKVCPICTDPNRCPNGRLWFDVEKQVSMYSIVRAEIIFTSYLWPACRLERLRGTRAIPSRVRPLSRSPQTLQTTSEP